MPGGTRSFNMTIIGEIEEGNYIPVDESKLKEDKKKNILKLLKDTSVNASSHTARLGLVM